MRSRYPNTKFNDDGISLSSSSLVSFLTGCKKAIIGLEVIDDVVLSQLPDLKTVSKYGVGLDSLDLEALQNRGIKLGWKKGVNSRSVSELVLSLAILLLRKGAEANNEVKNGIWKQRIGNTLTGKTVGILGCGSIGQDLVSLLAPFRCRINAHDINEYSDFYSAYDVEAVSLIDLLRGSDVVTVHLPLDHSTQHLLCAETLAQIRFGAVLINAARGGIVDELALKKLLITGQISAAAFDVFEIEPPEDSELLSLPNFFITPHIGGSAIEAVLAMGEAAIDGLDNAVDPLSF